MESILALWVHKTLLLLKIMICKLKELFVAHPSNRIAITVFPPLYLFIPEALSAKLIRAQLIGEAPRTGVPVRSVHWHAASATVASDDLFATQSATHAGVQQCCPHNTKRSIYFFLTRFCFAVLNVIPLAGMNPRFLRPGSGFLVKNSRRMPFVSVFLSVLRIAITHKRNSVHFLRGSLCSYFPAVLQIFLFFPEPVQGFSVALP